MRQRDAYLDNVKAILIVLVVIGHAIEPIGDSDSSEFLYRFIYLFHMPAFVLVTGYLSRSFRARPKAYLRLVATLLVPYLLFQTLHHLIRSLGTGQPMSWDYLTPEWTLWFLPAMLFWRGLTPVLKVLPAVLLVSVVVSLIATGWTAQLPQQLAINRTLQLLPFYVLGLSMTERHLEWIKTRSVRWPGRALFAGVGFGSLALFTWWSLPVVTGRTAFWNRETTEQLDTMGPVPGVVLRPVIMLLGVVGTVAVLAVASRRQHWWSYLGRYSIYVYLLHPLVLIPLRESGDFEFQGSVSGVVVVAMAAVTLAVVLASRPVRAVSKLVVEPPIVQPVLEATEKVVQALPDPVVEGVARAGEAVGEQVNRVGERLNPPPPDFADPPGPPSSDRTVGPDPRRRQI